MEAVELIGQKRKGVEILESKVQKETKEFMMNFINLNVGSSQEYLNTCFPSDCLLLCSKCPKERISLRACSEISFSCLNLNIIELYDIPLKRDQYVIKFLEKSLFSRISILKFNMRSYSTPLNFSLYSNALLKSLAKVTQRLCIEKCVISSKSIANIFHYGFHLEEIELSQCVLQTNGLKLRNNSSSLLVNDSSSTSSKQVLRHLKLPFCGLSTLNNWKANPEKLSDLFTAISDSALKYSLKCITLHHSCLNPGKMKELALKTRLDGIKMIGSEDSGLSYMFIV
ncbi:unnamed protein product [Moneuplotes crassus]|uniref:Uncharacterized protein n=1 Tax=Euplotes crassus TaxID=5936 RepID=A0AAD1XPG7_EUPCR|nr:unnamed protein product [Moneuplotes crassus]